jgi:competence protein ComGC
MRKYYPSGYRLHVNYLDDEVRVFPLWSWLLVVIVISLLLIVR